MLALSRELGRLAEDAATVSAQFPADAAMAVRVAEDMAGQAANLSSGRPAAGPAAALSRVLSAGRQPFLDRGDELESRPRAALNRARDAAGRRAGRRHPETRQSRGHVSRLSCSKIKRDDADAFLGMIIALKLCACADA
jgi:hypothetical protein